MTNRGTLPREVGRLAMLLFMPLAVVSGPPAALAEEEPFHRLITVNGEAEVQVVPDQVVLTLGVETFDNDLKMAKAQNDVRIKALLALAQEQTIDPKDVQTDYIGIEPVYEDRDRHEKLRGYEVRKTLVITLRDVSKFESLLSGALTSGANYLYGIEFRTSELRKYRDQARAMAIKAAQEKAAALAAELGQKIGRAHSIQEGYGGWGSGYRGRWGGRWSGHAQVVAMAGEGASEGGGTIALGQINVKAQVMVSFELVD